jgi:hypothetical protein
VFPAQHLTDLLTRNGIEVTKVLLYSETYNAFVQVQPEY